MPVTNEPSLLSKTHLKSRWCKRNCVLPNVKMILGIYCQDFYRVVFTLEVDVPVSVMSRNRVPASSNFPLLMYCELGFSFFKSVLNFFHRSKRTFQYLVFICVWQILMSLDNKEESFTGLYSSCRRHTSQERSSCCEFQGEHLEPFS